MNVTKAGVLKLFPDVDINESGGLDNFRDGESIRERDNIAVIIQHPAEEQYLIAKWNNGWCGLLTGGIESEKSIEENVRREILEETGFRNVLQIQQLECVSHGLFYHVVKHENRLAHYHLVFAKLSDLEQQDVSEEEQAIAKFTWVPKGEVEGVLTREDMKKLWRFYLHQKTH